MTREMKNSGVQWIGDIPVHWHMAPFRSYVIERGEKNKGEKTRELLALSFALGVTLYKDKVYNMDRVKDNYEDYQLVYKNDLVLSPNDIIKGSIFVSKYYGCISPMYNVFYARNDKTHYLPYLSYLLRTKEAGRQFFFIARGLIGEILENGKYVTRRMSVSKQDLMSFKVLLPPIVEQHAIVDYLDQKCAAIDELLEDLNKEVLTLIEYKKSIITESVTRGLERNVPMKAANIPWVEEIPQSWQVQKVKYNFENHKFVPGNQADQYERLALTLNGVVHRSKDDADGLQPKDFATYQLLQERELVFKLIDLQNVSTSRVGLSPYTGLVSPAYIILRANGDILPEFAEKYFLMLWHRQIFNALGDDGIRSNLSAGDLLNVPICYPSRDEQEQIVSFLNEKCSEIDRAVTSKQEQIEKLKAYKASLIYEYVTGKKQVAL